MSTYVFKAMDLTGAKASGEVEADSKQVVADQLKQRGLIVLDIADKRGSKELEIPFLNRIKPADLTIMTRQLATMVNSGMTILRALYVLEAQTENEKLVATLTAVRNLIREGKTHQILSAMQTGGGVGMQTLDMALATLVRAGKITQRVAESRSSTPEELKRLSGGIAGLQAA